MNKITTPLEMLEELTEGLRGSVEVADAGGLPSDDYNRGARDVTLGFLEVLDGMVARMRQRQQEEETG
jgi:hypothetical protein